MSPVKDAFEQPPEKGRLKQVGEGIWWLKMPLPFELDHINLYLIESDTGWTLVDTGLGGGFSRDIWTSLFEGPLAGKPVEQVIVTHFHPDHVGSAGWLCAQHGVPLRISQPEYDCTRLQQSLGDDTDQYFYFLHQLGLTREEATPIVKASATFQHMYDPLPETWLPLTQGEQLEIAGRQWQVQLADGHSPAHATLYCDSLKVLISGDQVLPRISSNVSVRMEDPTANPLACWLKGLEQLYRLPAETLVLPAHDGPFYGLHRRLDSLKAGHDKLLERLLGCCNQQPQTVAELAHQLYERKLSGFHLMMALGECKAHLRYLIEKQALAVTIDKAGRMLYTRIEA